MPNRRWKVSRRVFDQRLRIMWSNMIRVRTLCWLCFHYDPVVHGFDQKPLHFNEAGSQLRKTLAVQGSKEVPLKENTAATRKRWTANTVVTSDPAVAEHLPPVELMFKGGDRVRRSLLSVVPLGAAWLHVTTGEKASYRLPDVLEFLRKILPIHPAPAGGNVARWSIMMCDAYSAHLDPAVADVCWDRGSVLVYHGGGTTGATQVNDTHLHQPLSTVYQDLEQRIAMEQLSVAPHACPKRDRDDCVVDFAAVWQQRHIHHTAVRGHKHNFLTNALDGSEDHLASTSLTSIWNAVGMPVLRDRLIESVCSDFESGRLSWTKEGVASIVEPFPKSGQLDELFEGMSDEGDAANNDGAASDDGEVPSSPLSSGDEQGAVVPAPAGSVPAPAGSGQLVCLDEVAGEEAQRHAHQLALLDRMIEQAVDCEDPQVHLTLQRARAHAARTAHGSRQANPLIAQAVRKEEDAHREDLRCRRAEAEASKEAKQRVADKKKALQAASEELMATFKGLKDREREFAQKQAREGELRARAAALADAPKGFDPEMLGQGRLQGGTLAHRAARFDLLRRVRAAALPLPAVMSNDWERFLQMFDRAASAHFDKAWGATLLRDVQQVLADLRGGRADAFERYVRLMSRRWVA
ncbi:MAG: hypothetical protein GY725_15975, partial [bacterium]|nr:hypothetical protein [bacterium]